MADGGVSPRTEIVPLTPAFGPDSCEGNYESYLAAIAVMETVRAYPEPFDAVVQAGYRNPHGHPHPDVAARYAERGIPVWRTDLQGALRWRDRAPDAFVAWREARPNYWRDPPPPREPDAQP